MTQTTIPKRISNSRRDWLRIGFAAIAWRANTVSAQVGVGMRDLLMRMRLASSRLNYQGTLTFGTGANVASARIAHYRVGSEVFESFEELSGELRREFRHNDRVQTLWPLRRVAVIEPRTPINAAHSMTAIPDLAAIEFYRTRSGGGDRIAGRECELVVFDPVDSLRYPQKLWIDKASNLLLRADTLDPSGELLEFSGFSDVEIGGRPHPEIVMRSMRQLSGYRVFEGAVASARLDDEGWSIPQIPGFKLIASVHRPLARTGPIVSDRHLVLQSLFTDGMTHVSLFIENYDASRHRPMDLSSGPTHSLALRRDESWITVVGDVPMPTVQRFAEATVRRR